MEEKEKKENKMSNLIFIIPKMISEIKKVLLSKDISA